MQESTENTRAGPHAHCPLGRTGALLPALGLGCVTFGRELGEDESFRILDHALEQGLSLFDTAESYGTSEEIIGRWLASRDFPKEVTICTKVSFDNSPEHIACAVRGSIERLGIDQIDLYLLHVWDERVPIGETMSALKEQIDAGNVKALGGSNFTAEQLLAANEAGAKLGVRLEAVQNIYNLAKASEQDAVFDLCRNEDISF
ncbi:MAG: aldo/keto reductase, partial [Pirellulales bacterium]|nr:aldo/keto reductase [Pirellulales bacterium]